MAEEKRGLFGRLFGRRPQAEEPAAPEKAAPETAALPEVSEGLTPDAVPPAPATDGGQPPVAAETVEVVADAPAPAAPVGEKAEGEPQGGLPNAGLSPATVVPDEEPASTLDLAALSEGAAAGDVAPVDLTSADLASATEALDLPPAEPVAVPAAPSAPSRPFFADAAAPSVEPVEEAAPKASWLARLRKGLSRTTSSLAGGISSLFTKRKLDVGTLQDLEDLLIQADLGVETASAIADRISDKRYEKGISDDEVRAILAEEIEARLAPVAKPLAISVAHKPHVVLVVGVNGTGKTTTIGKISAQLRAHGRSVMLAAGDTFRAAAIAQLRIWGERTGAAVIARAEGSDAASLTFEAMKEAKEAGVDVLLIDTAGRLQNRAELMAELEKVIRVIRRHDPTAPHDVILTLDATTGQNAMNQVEIFGKTAGVTGLVMTKLDGTARGGILVAIASRHKLPVHFIGVGEGIDDLEPFSARDFARAIAGLDA
ncbi:signal recognition particle-docking protein FtsY [Pseudoxanthobacter soli DSM 19599]|uniref:Signal recognition particle receptor FtsY n=1 Tax=Pseudoxanthobacter soli DSM 19599 TaxID=1123029 RepID=A0A1M7ZMG5_9HYPH|nr:signal recognition particle-docking protein FtsY [Pseudoxanthobacter soli]SHO66098.1 signal recognition particle-docking protein FtsY [Pseudoxanthobacter soli DSM 19599]